jgi:eukaryotic-like serine/threonine-protein kinase
MTLSPGSRLGSYQIASRIGAGGMGEVYRATDTKLGREVAIKVLSVEFALDGDRLARFDREARALASLNHPNIATIHGVQDEGGTVALVMELVEGQTLADRIARAPLPLRETVAIARQIAEALEAAHERGIVHRDLKPGNVMIRPDGTVKVLDFGLAKDLRAEAAALAPTVALQTEAGVMMGTPAYMSPEQVRGEVVDRRTDIWAFGCVLFEMLTRTRLFDGASSADTVSKVLTLPIDPSAMPRDVPAPLAHLLARCLERDTRRRLRDIGEARVLLEEPATLLATTGTSSQKTLSWRAGVPIALVALFIGGIITGLTAWRLARDTRPQRVTYTSLPLVETQGFNYPGRRVLAVSPLGTHVAYIAGQGLWLRALEEREPHPVSGVTSDARGPFFSSDGQSVGYYASGAIWRVSLTGGAPTRVASSVNPWGASWSPDGTILYGQGPDGIWRVPGSGGEGKKIIATDKDESFYGPQLLPGGDWVLFTVLPAGVGMWDHARIVVQSLSSGQRVTLVEGGRDGRYVASGHLVYALREKLLAAPFDVRTRTLRGAAVPVVEGIADALNISGAGQFDIADEGTLVFVPQSVPDKLTLTWVDRQGHEEAVPAEARAYRHPRVSPDGQRIAVEVLETNDTNVWVADVRGAFSPLTREDGEDGYPIWSPDGSRVVFSSARNGGGLFSRPVSGASGDELLVRGVDWRPSTWTPDRRLVYERLLGGRVEVLGDQSESRARTLNLVNSPSYYDMVHPAISPDGHWIAYHSTESGESEVYVRPFPGISEGRWLVSRGGGYSPVWSADGKSLFYIEGLGQTRPARTPDAHLLAVSIQTRPTFVSGAPERLFSLRDYVSPSPQARNYDVAPDGRFLVLKDVTPGGSRVGNQIVVVQHWFQELRGRTHATR